MIARGDTGNAGANFADDAGTLMAEDRRKHPLGISARQGEGIRMADAGGHDLDQHLASARTVKINFHDFKWLTSSHRDSGTGFHRPYSLGRGRV